MEKEVDSYLALDRGVDANTLCRGACVDDVEKANV